MAGRIVIKDGTNGPLGNVRSVEGPDGMELIRLITLRSALQFNMKTGMNITRLFTMKLVKQTTGLKTNDKQKHMDRLSEMIEETRSKVVYVTEGEGQ